MYNIFLSINEDIKLNSYTIDIPDGKRKQILYRPIIVKYKVIQKQYRASNIGLGSTKATGQTAVVNVDLYFGWDYSWKYL